MNQIGSIIEEMDSALENVKLIVTDDTDKVDNAIADITDAIIDLLVLETKLNTFMETLNEYH